MALNKPTTSKTNFSDDFKSSVYNPTVIDEKEGSKRIKVTPPKKDSGRPKKFNDIKPRIFNLKMDQELYDKLQTIADRKYHGNKSETVTALINACYDELIKE